MRNAPLSLWIAFSETNGCKTSEIWRRKELSLSCIRLACMIRFCALLRALSQLDESSSSGHVFTTFSRTVCSLCLILAWKAVVKSKTKFNNNLRRGLVSCTDHHFSTQTARISLANRVLVQVVSGGHRNDFIDFFPPAFVNLQIARVNIPKILQRMFSGSSPICSKVFVISFFLFFSKSRT